MKLKIQVLAWDRHKKCGGVKLVNEIPTLVRYIYSLACISFFFG
jgi:hypothetical protein